MYVKGSEKVTFYFNMQWSCRSIDVSRAHHGVLSLDGFELQTVLHSSGGAVGLQLALHTFRTMPGVCLVHPVAFGWL